MAAVKWKSPLSFFKKNYFILIIGLCILFVGTIAFTKLFLSKSTYIYVKVKVGQGYWWASTAKPPIWYVDSIKVGNVAHDLLGSISAKVLSKRFYRYFGSDQYDVYLTLKLKVNYNNNTQEYNFNRSAISIGSPIEIQFPLADITGTVIDLSTRPIKDDYLTKYIYLEKRNAMPWEADAINIGDGFFDGENNIFEILSKDARETLTVSTDALGLLYANTADPRENISVKAKIKLHNRNGQWILGEDQLVVPGKTLNISTSNYVFVDYYVKKIASE